MARKTKFITIETEGSRDLGKMFLVEEMGAFPAEEWAARFVFAMGKNQSEIPEEALAAGAVGIIGLALRAIAGMAFDDAKPLLDEMLTCVSIVPDPSNPSVTRKDIRDDIEEPQTILFLRDAVIELHTDFSIAAVLSKLGAAAKIQASLDTSTSPNSSE